MMWPARYNHTSIAHGSEIQQFIGENCFLLLLLWLTNWQWLSTACTGLELSGGGGGWTPSLCLQKLIFEWKSALNFNPWAKFQTFRHLTPSSFRSIPTLIEQNTAADMSNNAAAIALIWKNFSDMFSHFYKNRADGFVCAFRNQNKKAVLSQRWPRDARYISRSWVSRLVMFR